MSKNGKIKVVVVDDHALIREAVRNLLAEHENIVLVGEGTVRNDVLPLVEELQPDVLLLDLSMPQNVGEPTEESLSVVPTLTVLQNDHKKTKVIILSQYLQDSIALMLDDLGISGYLLKSDDLSLKLAEAVEAVSLGGVYFSRAVKQTSVKRKVAVIELTDRQKEILIAVAQSPRITYKQLADEMCIVERTVKWHLTGAYRSLGVSNMKEALLVCIEYDLIPELAQIAVDFNVYEMTGNL